MKLQKVIVQIPFILLPLVYCFPVPVSAISGTYQGFENGRIYSSVLGTYAVIEPLNQLHLVAGGTGVVGFPTSDEYISPARGRCQQFEFALICERTEGGTPTPTTPDYCERYRAGNTTDQGYESACGTLLQTGLIDLPNVQVVSRKAWGAAYFQDNTEPETYNYFIRDRGIPINQTVNSIVIHHTTDSQTQSILELEEKEHIGRPGFHPASMPYHFIINGEGVIYEGRPLEYLGDHVVQQNHRRVGVALMGDFEPRPQNLWSPDTPTTAQLESLKKLVDDLQDFYSISVNDESITGHRFIPGQVGDCPGDKLEEYLSEIRMYAQQN